MILEGVMISLDYCCDIGQSVQGKLMNRTFNEFYKLIIRGERK